MVSSAGVETTLVGVGVVARGGVVAALVAAGEELMRSSWSACCDEGRELPAEEFREEATEEVLVDEASDGDTSDGGAWCNGV